MTYEEYGVWLERHVADCSEGEGRAMLKMCLSHFKEIAPTSVVLIDDGEYPDTVLVDKPEGEEGKAKGEK